MKKIIMYLAKAHWLFLTIAVISGSLFILMTPMMWGQDEPAHMYRIYQITQGEVIPDKGENANSVVPANLRDLGDLAIGDLVNNSKSSLFERRDVDKAKEYSQLLEDQFSSNDVSALSASTYSPISYLGPVMGASISNTIHLNIGQTLLLSRGFALVAYVALIFWALFTVQKYKFKWLVFVVALLPTSMFQASTLNADSLLIATSILFVSLLVRLSLDPKAACDKKMVLATGIIAIALPLIKPNYALLSLGILIIPLALSKSKAVNRSAKAAIAISAIFAAAIWSVLIRATDTPEYIQRPDGVSIDPASQLNFLIDMPLSFVGIITRSIFYNGSEYITQSTAFMGWNYVAAPLIITTTLLFLLVFAALLAKQELQKIQPQVYFIGLIACVGVLSVFITLYVAFTPLMRPLVEGVQGRYFIPFFLPLGMLLGLWLPIQLKIREGVAPFFFGIASSVCLAVCIWQYFNLTY